MPLHHYRLTPAQEKKMCQEISQGELLLDASKAAGVKGIVWSGLVPAQKISGGKYTKVEAFDGKALVTEYGRASGIPFVEVQAGFYATNLLGSLPLFAKQTARRHIYVVICLESEHNHALY
jgi:hypothetical protein